LFDRASDERPKGASDLIPYWIFETEGGAQVERRMLLQPLSKEQSRAKRLRKSLILYRMVFGQPRQEDLLHHLEGQFGEDEAKELAKRWRINLEPGIGRQKEFPGDPIENLGIIPAAIGLHMCQQTPCEAFSENLPFKGHSD
jgi:hypothetical protein